MRLWSGKQSKLSCTVRPNMHMVCSTGLTHAKLVSLTSPCCSGWPAPMNTPQGQQCELSSDRCADFNAWLESDLVLIINPHTWHIIYITCYFLIIGTDIKFNHSNSAIPFFGTLAQPFHFRQWLRVCAMKTGTSYFGSLFPTCQQVLGHPCHIWYSLWLKSLTHNHSTRVDPLVRVHCVMTGVFGRKWKGCASVPKHWGFVKWT